jgi:light-regulated signal transduction histidine kinase (bacteriophytochrome)
VVTASRDELTRLFQNLIGNALKFRAAGCMPVIEVSVQAEPGSWVFTVADNGIGIDPGQFERLFKMFQRLHGRDHYEGNGIGLAVCRKIVEHHKGRIWVESKGKDEGSSFRFSLPAAAVAGDAH